MIYFAENSFPEFKDTWKEEFYIEIVILVLITIIPEC
jgi:hypothetical protein